MENQICSRLFTDFSISFQVSGITRQILTGAELDRIYKHTDHYPVIFLHRLVNQALMPLMKISHGRHQSHRQAFLSPCLYLFSDILYRLCNSHLNFPFSQYNFSITLSSTVYSCSSAGNAPLCTSPIYCFTAVFITSPILANRFTNFGVKSENIPSMS